MKHKPLNISYINGSVNQSVKSTNFISKDSKNTISNISNSKDLDNYLRTSFEYK